MRWTKPPTPKHGDTRYVCKFLWMAETIDGEWRWLERAWVKQRWDSIQWYDIAWARWQDTVVWPKPQDPRDNEKTA